MSTDARGARRRHVLRLGGMAVAMFAFGFALVPLYDVLCDITGLNGRTGTLVSASSLTEAPVEDRTVTVEFVTTVNGGQPWRFGTDVRRMQVQPGRLYTVEFEAENLRDEAVVAQAVPSVVPWNAARHLKKTECFCFSRQPFGAREAKRMPMRFMLEPGLPAEVETVTLSYTFFDATDVAQR